MPLILVPKGLDTKLNMFNAQVPRMIIWRHVVQCSFDCARNDQQHVPPHTPSSTAALLQSCAASSVFCGGEARSHSLAPIVDVLIRTCRRQAFLEDGTYQSLDADRVAGAKKPSRVKFQRKVCSRALNMHRDRHPDSRTYCAAKWHAKTLFWSQAACVA